MKIPIPGPLRNEGSSLVLAILVGVAAVVIIALMIRTSGIGKKGRETGKQEDAIAETMNVFNKYDAVMDEESKASEAVDKKVKPAPPKAPMHFTSPPAAGGKSKDAKKDGAAPSRPQASAERIDGGADAVTGGAQSSYGVLDVVTGADLAGAFGDGGAGSAESDFSFNDPALTSLLPAQGVAASFEETATVSESGGASRSIGSSSVPELNVALREAAAMKDGFSATAQPAPINMLSAPLFSHSSGTFPLKVFDISLKLANPNPKEVSRLLYSVNDGDWVLHEGEVIAITPGTQISAYCESRDRDWSGSPVESRNFLAQTAVLSEPRIFASASKFDDGANRRISIAISNPNHHAACRVEYRVGGGPWLIYRGATKIDGSDYTEDGAWVEARVVGVLGVEGRQASDVVVLELLSAENIEDTAAVAVAGVSKSIAEPESVDLAAPEQAHGYRVRNSAGTVEQAMNDAPLTEKYLLETFEAYRRYREELAAGSADPLEGDRFGVLGMTVRPDGRGAGAIFAGGAAGEGALEEKMTSLFESGTASAGIFQ